MTLEQRAENAGQTRDVEPFESDEALYLRYAGGDRAAFDEIVVRHQKFAYHLAFFVGKNRTFAEESVQDAFSLLAGPARRFADQGPGSFKSWFGSIVVNCARTLVRNERAKMNRIQSRKYRDRVREISQPQAVAPNEKQTLEDDARQAIRQSLDELREELRLPLMLHFYEGLSQSDISRMVGVSQTVIKRRMTKGLELLRIRLNKQNITLSSAVLAQTLAAGQTIPIPETLPSVLAQLASNPVAMAQRAARAVNYGAQSAKAVGGATTVKWAVALAAATTAVVAGTVWLDRVPASSTSKKLEAVTSPAEPHGGWSYKWDFQNGVPDDLHVVAGQWRHMPATEALPALMTTDTEVYVLLPKKVEQELFVVETTVVIADKPATWCVAGWSTEDEMLGFRHYSKIMNQRVSGLRSRLIKLSYFFVGDLVIRHYLDRDIYDVLEFSTTRAASRVGLSLGQNQIVEIRMYSLSESEIPSEVQAVKNSFTAEPWPTQSIVSPLIFRERNELLRKQHR